MTDPAPESTPRVQCPKCHHRAGDVLGPEYQPRLLRRPLWVCAWCNWRWPAPATGR